MENDRKQIILVDDMSHSLIAVRDRLKEHYEVFPAQTVARMFEILGRITPDLILLDINMPDVNGYDAIQQLKTDSRYADIPVIFLSARSDDDSIAKGLNLGAADYVQKPFSVPKLIERIENQFAVPDTPNETVQAENVRKKIIYVDDVHYSLVSVKSRLKDRYEIYPAQSVAIMFDLLKHVTPDLILLDVNMPKVNGYEAIGQLKADKRYERIPVIFLTGNSGRIFPRREDMLKAKSLGAADYMTKPFTDAELIERIECHVNPQQATDASLSQSETMAGDVS